MKSKAILTILMAIFCLSSVIGMTQTVVKTAGQPQKKEQRVKVVINENGKLIEKDTTFVTSDGKGLTFSDKGIIYKADTIIISKDGKSNEQTVTVVVNNDKGNAAKGSKSGTYKYTYTTGDTANANVTPKMIRTGDGKHMIIMKSGESENFDLPAPPPSARAYRVVGYPLRDPFAFDPTDTTIVSYNKKDIGKGEEKITIVRKKAVQAK